MFSKSKINDPIETNTESPKTMTPKSVTSPISGAKPNPNSSAVASASPVRPKTAAAGGGPSIISPDLKVIGNLQTEGDLQVEGIVDGDIRAHLLTIGENATITGEVVAEDVVVNGHVIGRIRGQKVRLTATGRVEGDILHKTIAIEAGAHFEGSVHRADDPINGAAPKAATASSSSKPAETAKVIPSAKAG